MRLDRDIERGRRLVGDQNFGVARERHRDHGALPHTPRELVRERPRARRSIGDTHETQELDRAIARVAAARWAVQPDRLDDLPPHRVHGVQARHGLLKNHRDLGAADPPQLALRGPGEIDPAEAYFAGVDARAFFRQEPEQRQRRHALAAPRLADEAERATTKHVERDVAHRSRARAFGDERDRQAANGKHGRTRVGHGRGGGDAVGAQSGSRR